MFYTSEKILQDVPPFKPPFISACNSMNMLEFGMRRLNYRLLFAGNSECQIKFAVLEVKVKFRYASSLLKYNTGTRVFLNLK